MGYYVRDFSWVDRTDTHTHTHTQRQRERERETETERALFIPERETIIDLPT